MMPEIRGETRAGERVTLELFVAASLGHFSGHFPGCPILPGVVQIDWAVRLARRHFDGLTQCTGVDGFKCRAPVLPNTALTLTLTREPGRLRFAYAEAARTVSSGALIFR